MSIQTQLSEMESVEDLFALLDVPFDPKVVAVHRMRILKRFGQEKARIDALGALLEGEGKTQYVAALTLIHEQCSRGMRETEPVFKGISQQLVQLGRGPRRNQAG
jgi:nitrogenase-stabilizing/protective protein